MKKSYKDKIAFIGCGEFPMKDAVNVDIRDLPGVDVVADARKLPFKDGELGGVASRNIIEHFGRFEIDDVAKEWARVIKKGGFVIFETVDMGRTMDQWRTIPADRLLDAMYGAQTYPENFHKMLMVEPLLYDIFQKQGLKFAKVEHSVELEIPRVKMVFVK